MPSNDQPTRALRFSTLDFKVGARMLARYPGLTVVGTAAIAVAIALGTLYFEAVNKFKNPRLPVPNAERVVSIRSWDVNGFNPESRLLHDFTTWKGELKTVDHLGAAITFSRNLTTDNGRVEPVFGAEMSASAFGLVGVPPLIGRTFTARDENPGEPPVVVIGQSLWKSRFDSDPNVVGRAVKLGTISMTVIGVMPERFGFPINHRIWTPLRAEAAALTPRSGPSASIFGRLAPGASMDDARAELAVIANRMAANFPDTHKHLRLSVSVYEKPFDEGGQMRFFNRLLVMVNGVVLLLLSVVCINVATLVFARTATRGWEITVRTALGASRSRIIAQLFIEALMLTGLAAIVGLFIAKVVLRYGLHFMANSTEGLPFWIDDSFAWSTVLYTTMLAFFGATIVGVLPALRVTRINVHDAMRNEGASRSGLRFGGLWTAVIVVQVAISVAFLPLAANGVFASNRFKDRADGVGAEHFIAARVDMDREGYSFDSTAYNARARARIEELEQRLRAEPGVEQVAFADRLPVEDQFKYEIEVDSTLVTKSSTTDLRVSTLVHVGPGFFEAFGSSLVSGRSFASADIASGHAMIVNASFARHVFGGRNAVGQRIRIGNGEDERLKNDVWYEIVGVVKDFGWQLPEPREQSAMYLPSNPIVGAPGTIANQIAVKVNDPSAFAARLRSIAVDVDPTIRISDVKPLAQVGGGEAQINWTLTVVAWVISFIVLVLSATGIHALMSFTVARRTREIGIRAALGANTVHIVRDIFSRAFVQIGVGLLVGSTIVVLAAHDSMRQFLLLIGADIVMLAVGLGACALPLRRALRVDPTEALRAEG